MPKLFKRFTISDAIALAGILLITVLGILLLKQALTWGVWAFSDSTEYIVSGKMLATGHGLSIPSVTGGYSMLELHPPLYPLVISLFYLLKADPLNALAGLNLVLFAVTIFISGGLTYYLVRDPLLAISASALVALPPTMLRNFDGAMSEPLYIPLIILATLLLAWHWQKGSRSILIIAAIATCLAGLTRYIGLALLMVGLPVILLNRQKLRRRLWDAAIFIAIGAGPVLAWFIYLFSRSGQLAARSITIASDLGQKLLLFRKSFMETLVMWMPYTHKLPSWTLKALLTYAILALGMLAAVLSIWRILRKNSRHEPGVKNAVKVMIVVLLSAVAYVAFMLVSYLFSSMSPDIDDRTLAPLLPLLMLFLCLSFFTLPRAFGLRRIFQVLPLIVVLVAGQFYFMQTYSLAGQRDQQSRGYASPRWRTSELWQAIGQLPADQPLISNMPVPVLLYTDRYPYAIEEIETKQVQADPLRYGDGIDPVQIIFHRKGAALIIFEPEFDNQMAGLYGSSGHERVKAFLAGLKVIRNFKDGAIYIYP